MTSKKLVPCIPLRSVLTPEQYKAVEPFLRDTFTETWVELCAPNASSEARFEARLEARYVAQFEARATLRAATAGIGHTYACDAAEGRVIERALYLKAGDMKARAVMGPARR